MSGDVLTWFLVVLVHTTVCPGKCVDTPALAIQMPSKEVCVQVRDLNPDDGLKCWGQPKEPKP